MANNSIIFKAAFSNRERIVELSQPNGGGGGYHLMVDKRYWGLICQTLQGWKVLLQNPEKHLRGDEMITYDDMQILLDIIAEHEKTKAS